LNDQQNDNQGGDRVNRGQAAPLLGMISRRGVLAHVQTSGSILIAINSSPLRSRMTRGSGRVGGPCKTDPSFTEK